MERTTDLEVVGIVDGGFGAECLTFDRLYWTWSDGTTASVNTRVRKLPGVRRVTRRSKIIDVVPGRGGMFSLEGPTGQRFLTRSRVDQAAEWAWLLAHGLVT